MTPPTPVCPSLSSLVYYATSSAGEKSCFISDDFRIGCQQSAPVVSRRLALKSGIAGLAAFGGLSGKTRPAEAGFFGFVAQTVLAAAIHWLVKTLLDDTFKGRPNDFARELNPQPSKNPFHNFFADQYRLTSADSYIDDTKVNGIDFGMQEHMRLIDLNVAEIDQIKNEKAYLFETFGTPWVLPAGLRRDPQRAWTPVDTRALRQASSLYGIRVDPEDVHYSIQLTNGRRGGERRGFYVKRGEKSQFLIN